MRIRLNQEPRIHLCEPNWSWFAPGLEDHDLWCTLGGRGELTVDGRSYLVSPGACWLLEPGQVCRGSHDPRNRLRVLAVHFDPVTDANALRSLTGPERPVPGARVSDLGLLEAMARGCVAAYRRGGHMGHQQVHHFLHLIHLQLLEASSTETPPAMDSRIARVHDAVLEDPGREWTVPGMSRMAGLSASQFTRLFRQCTGRSPARCVLEARVDRAGILLRDSTVPVGEIADALGYRDIFYFSRQFKALTGQTPSAWRAKR